MNFLQDPFIALVPMRHTSERVPGKNYRSLVGKPLYAYILNSLRKVPEIAEIIVDTDSPVIKEGLAADFPAIKVLDRPAHLTAPAIPMNDIILHDVNLTTGRLFLQTHSTNPLLRPETMSAAIQTFRESFPAIDSLFSVTKVQKRFWTAEQRPWNHNPRDLIPTQDLPALYEENSCFYLFEKDVLLKNRNRIGDRPYLFEIPPLEAIDIDVEQDFEFAEAVIKAALNKNDAGAG